MNDRGGLVAGLSLSNLRDSFRVDWRHFFDPILMTIFLRCRVKDGLAAADGLGLQDKPKLITFQPDVQLASTDAQLLTDHLMADTAMKRSNLLLQWIFYSFLVFVPNENCLVTPAVTRTVLRSRCHCPRSSSPGK